LRSRILFFTLLLTFTALPLSAGETDDPWNCYLVTVGPGNELYLWFGHTGLILEERETGRAVFYDFGNFSFKADHFYRNFAMGRLIYSSVGVSAGAYLNYITRENRDVTVQTLNLPAEKKVEMAAYLQWKVQPENNTYLYHHYLDNCSTRIRDLIDQALDGQLHEATDIPAGTDFRRSFRRFSGHNFWADWFLSFLQGRTIDRPIQVWDTMFLPRELMRQVSALTVETPDGPRPLVENTEVLVTADGRSETPAEPVSNFLPAVLYGLLTGLFLLAVQKGALSGSRKIRTLSRIGTDLILIPLSLTGGLLYFMILFTNHQVTYENINMMVIHPLYFLIPVLQMHGRKKIAQTGIRLFWQIQSVLYLLMVLINLLPSFRQGNLRTAGFFFPLLLLQAAVLPSLIKKKEPCPEAGSCTDPGY